MRTVEYAIDGKVRPDLKGKIVRIKVAESIAEAATLCDNGTDGVVEKFVDGYTIRVQDTIRRLSAPGSEVTLEKLQETADGLILKHRAPGQGPKPRTAAGEAQAKARDAGNKLFEKALADEKFRERLEKLGALDAEEFNAWRQAREKAQAEKAKA